MTAIARIGGEWTPFPGGGGLYSAGSEFHGTTPASGAGAEVTIVEPGRTGGAMYSCDRGTGSGAHTALVALSTQAEVPEDTPLIGRAYLRINQAINAPASANVTTPGIPVFAIGYGEDTLHVYVCNDGRFAVGLLGTFDAAGGGPPFGADFSDFDDDPSLVMPIGEWVMIEAALSWSTTTDRVIFVRVTLPDEGARVIYRRCHVAADPSAEGGEADLFVGMLLEGGAGLIVDVDDLGLNLGDAGPNNTWLGPGEVRMARPTADGAIADVFEIGRRSNTSHGVQGRTIGDHPDGPIVGDPLEVCPDGDFFDALNNNPISNPVGTPGRCSYDDIMVTSSGSDWHEHGQLVSPPSTFATVYRYDHPRLGAAGDTLTVECDCSDQTGDISFAMACGIAGRWEYGTVLLPEPTADRYFAMWTQGEAPPTAEDPADDANFNFGRWGGQEPGVDGNWEGITGRRQQAPALGATVDLTLRREYDCTADPEGHSEDYYEWLLLGVGVVYESGFVEQEPLPVCGQLMSLV